MVAEKPCNNNEWTFHENKQVEPVQLVKKDIYQSNTCIKDLSWLHFDDKPKVQERDQVKDQEYYIPVSVAYLLYTSSSRSTNPGTRVEMRKKFFL